MLGVGSGEALNEIAVSGREWPEFKERFARLREAVDLIRDLWTKEGVSSDGPYYKTVDASSTTVPETPAGVRRRGWSAGREVRRPGRRWVHRDVRQGHGPLHREADPRGEGRRREGGSRFEDSIGCSRSSFVRPGSRARPGEHPVLGAAVADSGAEAQRRRARPRWNGWPTSCRSSRSRSAGSLRPTRKRSLTQLQPYLDAGFNHLVVHGPGHDQERFLPSSPRRRPSAAPQTGLSRHNRDVGDYEILQDSDPRCAELEQPATAWSLVVGRSAVRPGPRAAGIRRTPGNRQWDFTIWNSDPSRPNSCTTSRRPTSPTTRTRPRRIASSVNSRTSARSGRRTESSAPSTATASSARP